MERCHGRCRRGQRLRSGVPHGNWKTTTLVAGLRRTGMIAPMVLDGPINGDPFVAKVRQVFVPDLSPGGIVIMTQPVTPGGSRCPPVSEAPGVKLLFLPPCSPDFDLIKQPSRSSRRTSAFAVERTIHALGNAIGRIVDLYPQQGSANYLTNVGYSAD